jgi:signal transduction histidine kinase
VLRAARGFSPATQALESFGLADGYVGQAILTGEPVIVEDVATDSQVNHRITDPEGIRSFMHVPIQVAGQVFGVFNVNYQTTRAFGHEAQRLFTALAQRAALAIENAQLYTQAQQAAALEERQRLARELHDAVTQTLFSATLIAEVLPRIWERNQQQGRERLIELHELNKGALAEMRALLLELRPNVLAEAELSDLLQQLADSITGRARVPVRLRIEGETELSPEVKVALYRIAQEALNNVAKHAGASQAMVNLSCENGALKLQVSDDGQGFDPASIPPERLGIGIMHERAAKIGAELSIESHAGHGTCLTVVWREV